MTGGFPNPSSKERSLYELVTGKAWPAEPTRADRARMRTLLVLHGEDEKRLAQQKRIASRARTGAGAPVRPQKVAIPTEREEQVRLAKWLDARSLLWCHVPNEGRRSGRTGAGLRAQGLKKGFPDVALFSPLPRPPGAVQPRGVAIELKRVKGGRLSEEQNEWLVELSKAGWLARCCNGAGEAIRWLEGFGW